MVISYFLYITYLSFIFHIVIMECILEIYVTEYRISLFSKKLSNL